MADHFYALNGDDVVHCSSGAAELLYGVLVLLAERRQQLTAEERVVVEWLRTSWREGVDSCRAFRLDRLPVELSGDARLGALESLLEEFARGLCGSPVDLPDPMLPGGGDPRWVGDEPFRWGWIHRVWSLHELIREAMTPEGRPAALALPLAPADALGVRLRWLEHQSWRVAKYRNDDRRLLAPLLEERVSVVRELRRVGKDGSERLTLGSSLWQFAERLVAEGLVSEAIPYVAWALELEDDPEARELLRSWKDRLQGQVSGE